MAFLTWQLWHSKVMLTMSANWWRSWYFRCDGVRHYPAFGITRLSPMHHWQYRKRHSYTMPEQQALGTLSLNRNIEPTVKVYCSGIAYNALYTGIVAPRVGSRTPGPLMYARKTYLQCNDGNARWHTGFQNAFARLLWSEHPFYLPSSLATFFFFTSQHLHSIFSIFTGDAGWRQKHILLISQTLSCQEFKEFMSS